MEKFYDLRSSENNLAKRKDAKIAELTQSIVTYRRVRLWFLFLIKRRIND